MKLYDQFTGEAVDVPDWKPTAFIHAHRHPHGHYTAILDVVGNGKLWSVTAQGNTERDACEALMRALRAKEGA